MGRRRDRFTSEKIIDNHAIYTKSTRKVWKKSRVSRRKPHMWRLNVSKSRWRRKSWCLYWSSPNVQYWADFERDIPKESSRILYTIACCPGIQKFECGVEKVGSISDIFWDGNWNGEVPRSYSLTPWPQFVIDEKNL
jgi:hypothetical protein